MKFSFLERLNKISLKTQLATLTTVIFTAIIILIILYNYQSNSKAVIEHQTNATTGLLQLEAQNLDAYFSEIDRYSLLLRHNESFMHIISSRQPMTYQEQTDIHSLLRSNFDSRNDLLSYRLYLLNNPVNFKIDSAQHKVQSFYDVSIEDLPDYKNFTTGKEYKSILSSEKSGQLMVYYRTIIRISDKEPLAVVELTFDDSYIKSLTANHNNSGELVCLFDNKNRLLYTNNDGIINGTALDVIVNEINSTDRNHFTSQINHKDFLAVYKKSDVHNYTLAVFKPLDTIEKQLAETRNISLLLGLFSIIITMMLSIIFIRLITNPLSTLAHRLRRVGTGNFSATADIGGSREITSLAQDFNTMIHQIDELIKKNYISELNEKTARLIALEAQVNPHFLYNTLQAISAEAVVNGQQKINLMITALASMLRYAIKSNDLVTAAQEIKHVKDYLFLQKARFEDSIRYSIDIAPGTEELSIPKLSIQTLVENSIIHGMKGEKENIEIKVNTYLDNDHLFIVVLDNGCGLSEDQLSELNSHFKDNTLPKNNRLGIGLLNLSNRLQLLYNSRASLSISSIQNRETKVVLTIPVSKEDINVQGTDNRR
jgi:two-component system sensor histidine kinase YesM